MKKLLSILLGGMLLANCANAVVGVGEDIIRYKGVAKYHIISNKAIDTKTKEPLGLYLKASFNSFSPDPDDNILTYQSNSTFTISGLGMQIDPSNIYPQIVSLIELHKQNGAKTFLDVYTDTTCVGNNSDYIPALPYLWLNDGAGFALTNSQFSQVRMAIASHYVEFGVNVNISVDNNTGRNLISLTQCTIKYAPD